MEECLNCGNESVAYDGYKGIERCLIDGCTFQIISRDDKGKVKTYSILRYNSGTNSMDRIELEVGSETIVNPKILKSYRLD